MPGDKSSKTEKATAGKLKEARGKGQVARSQDLTQTASLISGIIMFGAMLPKIQLTFKQLFQQFFLDFDFSHVAPSGINMIVIILFKTTLMLVMPILLVVWVAVFAVASAQVGFHFSVEGIKPSLNKINPVSGFQRLFSMRGVIRTGLSVVKMIFIALVTSSVLLKSSNTMVLLHLNENHAVIAKTGAILWEMIFKAFIVLITLALIDYFYQRWQFAQDQKMSKQDIKDEHKQQEGSPEIKSKVRSKQREASQRKGLKENVETADVVVVNPFHIAVAIKYDRLGGDQAPIIVAKGARLLALRIKEFARDAGIEIVENIPLARSLYKQCHVDFEIPPDLYVAVAEILALVFKKREAKRRHF